MDLLLELGRKLAISLGYHSPQMQGWKPEDSSGPANCPATASIRHYSPGTSAGADLSGCPGTTSDLPALSTTTLTAITCCPKDRLTGDGIALY